MNKTLANALFATCTLLAGAAAMAQVNMTKEAAAGDTMSPHRMDSSARGGAMAKDGEMGKDAMSEDHMTNDAMGMGPSGKATDQPSQAPATRQRMDKDAMGKGAMQRDAMGR